MQLSNVFEHHASAMNPNPAWGYSPNPIAERQTDGSIKVTTYEFEGEWKECICKTPEEVDFYLYTENGSVEAISNGKHFMATLVLEKAGFTLRCAIDDTIVSLEEYTQAYPKEMKEDEMAYGEWLPGHWVGPGKWEPME